MTASTANPSAPAPECWEIQQIRALRGPNLWGRRTALEVVVRLGEASEPVSQTHGLLERLHARLPSPMVIGEAETLAHVLQHATLALQAAAGCPLTFGHTMTHCGKNEWKVVVEYTEEDVGRLAVKLAKDLVDSALADKPFDTAAAVASLRTLDENVRLGPSTGSIVRAAVARGIPFRRLNDGSLVQFGWGAKARRILAAETDATGAIAESIAQDKELTKELLRAAGVPVPKGRPVEDAEDAWAAAQEIGVPVVVKPQDGNQGRGVAVNLRWREQVHAAYAAAREESRRVIVERFAPGCDFRVLVIGGKVVAAARREPPQVVGDGGHTVDQLVELVNRDPRRGEDHATSLSKMRLDDIGLAVLAEQGFGAQSVPEKGLVVVLRRNANLSTGGSATDVTDEVHPQIAARAADAARMVGLDIAGVDVVCRDIARPLEEQGGVIVEVNAAPGLRMHLSPSCGCGRPVGEAIANLLFPQGDGRIPVTAVTGTNGKTTTVRLLAHIWRTYGRTTGFTCTDGIFVNNQRVDDGDCSGPKSARGVLLNPSVEAAVLETARGGILREGLGFDRCDVAVVTNVGAGDHLGINGIRTAEDLAKVKRVVVENVSPTGTAVLNAADPLVAAMAESCPGAVLLFARDASNPVLAAHRACGGRAAFVRDGAIWVADGSVEERIADVADVPVTLGGRIGFEVENALAAAAAARAGGVPREAVHKGLTTFVNDAQRAPGRFNVMQHEGATVIADYGHNVDAMAALAQALDQLPARRRLAVFSCAGDRCDEDIVRMAQICGDTFDEMVIFEDACNRGRERGEVLGLMRRGLGQGRRVSEIHEMFGEHPAIEAGVRRVRPGELILVQVDQIDSSMAFLRTLLERLSEEDGDAVLGAA